MFSYALEERIHATETTTATTTHTHTHIKGGGGMGGIIDQAYPHNPVI